MKTLWFAALITLGALPAQADAPKEADCANKADDDGDGLPDCADADCVEAPTCKPDGNPEGTDARCSDYIDNDNNGYIDCDDSGCSREGVGVCKGTWKGPLDGTGAGDGAAEVTGEDLPELGEGQSVEDLIGKGSDADGERNEYLCADGVDNDNDGRTDCADFGCRFDPEIKVCQGNPGMRFSVVANVAASYDFELEQPDVNFTKLQLRTFGPMPLIQDSFYYISLRAERTPRLTFAMFQVPIVKGHFVNINSGGGGLSNALALSSSKHLLIDPAFYLTSAFDPGNSASAEFTGPIDQRGIVSYRAYVAGGSGFSTGNVGGRYFGFDGQNFSWGGGASFTFNIIGRHSRWDSEFLYTSAPMALALAAGAKYDEREQERYVAENVKTVFRWGRFALSAEAFFKQEFDFNASALAYNVQLGVLLVEKYLLLGADFGEFLAGDFDIPRDQMGIELRRQLDELQARAALHTYFLRNVGVASLVWTYRSVDDPESPDPAIEHGVRLELQYRF